MKILQHNPGIVRHCRYCNSQYEIYEDDKITVRSDILLGKLRPDWYWATWECPSCGTKDSQWLHELPGRWSRKLLELFKDELKAEEEEARKNNTLHDDRCVFSQTAS